MKWCFSSSSILLLLLLFHSFAGFSAGVDINRSGLKRSTADFKTTQRGFADISAISLQSPENDHRFTLRESQLFTWSGINSSYSGQRQYIINMVFVNEGQSAEDAILLNESWHCDTTDLTTSNSSYVYNLSTVKKYLPTYQKIAWQVTAMDENESVLAVSNVFTLYGPPFMEAFYLANDYIMFVDTTTVLDMNNLAGRGHMTFRGKNISVEYKNLKINRGYLAAGAINHPYKDTVTLRAETPEGEPIQFFCDTLYMNKDYIYKKGVFKWVNSILEEDTIVSSYSTVLLNGGKLLGAANFKEMTLKLNPLGDAKIKFNTTSSFFLREPSYLAELDGTLTKVFENSGGSDTIKFQFKKAPSLYYAPLTVDPQQKEILLNKVVKIMPSGGYLDLSTANSPKPLTDLSWKGIWINKYNLSFNDTNKRHFFRSYPAINIPVDLEKNPKFHFSFGENKWQLVLDTVFTNQISCYYNGFTGKISSITLNRPYSTEANNQILGNITIPYLPEPSLQDYVINLNETSVVDTLSQNIDDFSFNEISKNDITAFYIMDGTEKIPAVIDEDEKTIKFTLPAGADKQNVKCYFVTNGINVTINGVKQVRGETVNDFTNSLIYEVQSGEGVYKNYTVSRNIGTATDVPQPSVNVRIYPNPATNKLYLEGLPSGASIAVYSMEGRLMMQRSCHEAPELLIDNLTPGLYLLKISSKEGDLNFKFTKE